MQRANWSLGGPRENAAAYITVSHRSGDSAGDSVTALLLTHSAM